MPDVAGLTPIVDLFIEMMGPYMGGLEVLTLQEIKAWCDLSGITLTPWEATTIRNMSRSYVVQFNRSNGTMESPPYYHDAGKVDVSAKFKALAQRQAE